MVVVLDYHTVARMKNAYDIQMDNNPLSSDRVDGWIYELARMKMSERLLV